MFQLFDTHSRPPVEGINSSSSQHLLCSFLLDTFENWTRKKKEANKNWTQTNLRSSNVSVLLHRSVSSGWSRGGWRDSAVPDIELRTTGSATVLRIATQTHTSSWKQEAASHSIPKLVLVYLLFLHLV